MCRECEIQLSGTGSWALPDGGDDVSILHTPGHTEGSLCLFYRPHRALFTGDSLAFVASGDLTIMPRYNKDSIARQLASIERLAELDALLVLPGHCRRGAFADAQDRADRLRGLVRREGGR